MSYEVADMEKAVAMAESGNVDTSENGMYLEYTRVVMKIMTYIRKQWQMTFAEEDYKLS